MLAVRSTQSSPRQYDVVDSKLLKTLDVPYPLWTLPGPDQGDFHLSVLLENFVLNESPQGHLRYGLTDVPPQPSSPPDSVSNPPSTRLGR